LVAHSVAVDECAGELYLADREGARVVVFDLATYGFKGERRGGARPAGGWPLVWGPFCCAVSGAEPR